MNRLTVCLTAAALAAAGLVAADATTAAPRIDPSKVQPRPAIKPQPQIKPGVLKLSDCSPHFKKQTTGGKSYNCHFTFKPVCRNGTVLGPVLMKKVGSYWRVTYSCYEPPR